MKNFCVQLPYIYKASVTLREHVVIAEPTQVQWTCEHPLHLQKIDNFFNIKRALSLDHNIDRRAYSILLNVKKIHIKWT